MAGGARRIVVEFIGDGKNLAGELSNIEGRTHRFGSVMAKAGKYAAIGLGAGLVAAGAAGVKFAQAAAQDEQSANLMANALRNNAKASDEQIKGVEDWISVVGRQTGVADDDLRPALSRLVTATHDVGKATELTRLAMDVSAGSGKSLEAVSTALMKAQNGQVSSLSRLGINTKNAAGETISMEEAVHRMADTFGGAAAEKADTMQGKMDRLKLILSETGEAIGYKLIPMISDLATWFLEKALPAISKTGDWIQANLMPAFHDMADFIGAKVLPVLGQIGQWIGDHVLPMFQQLGQDGPSIFSKIRDVIDSVVPVVIKIAKQVGDNLKPVFDQLVATFRGSVLPTVEKLIDRFQEWWPTISKVIGKVADLASTILGTLLPPIIKFAGVILEKGVPAVLDMIEVLAKIVGKIFEVGSAFVDGIKDVAKWVQGVSEKIGNAIGYIKDIPSKAKAALGNIGSALADAGRALIQGLIDGIWDKVNDLKGVLSKVTDLIPDWKGPRAKDKILLTPAGQAIMEGLIKGIEKGKVPLQRVLEKITEFIQKHGDKLKDLLDKRQSIVDSFKGMTSSIFSTDLSPDAEGNAPTIQRLLDAGAQRKASAQALSANVQTLLDKGLSKDLLQQMIDAGEAGAQQIALLASGTQAQIDQANADNDATRAALEKAGLAVGDAIYGAQIAQEQQAIKQADIIRDKLKELLDLQDKNTIVELHLDGQKIYVSLKKLKKQLGHDLDL